MRITNQTLSRRSLHAVSDNLRRLAEAQDTVSSGLRIRLPSDDPSGAAEVMRSRSALRDVAQLQRNLDFARGSVAAEEDVLAQLTDVLTRGEELAVGQASATASADTRLAAKGEVDNLIGFVLGLGNTRSGNGYLFGGDFADSPPFDAGVDLTQPPARDLYLAEDPGNPPAKREPTGEPTVRIGTGFELPTTHNGARIFLDTGALEALHGLSQALGANDVGAIRSSLDQLQGAFDGVQLLVGEIGARSRQLDTTESSLKSLAVTLDTYRSGLEEADFTEAATDLATRQSAYQAALLATSRVLNLSLTDYLR